MSANVISLFNAALKAAHNAAENTAKAKGHSVRFAQNVLRLAAIGTDEAKAKGEELAKACEDIAGGKGYGSNARRVFSAPTDKVQAVLAHYEDAGNGGFKALSNVFTKFPEEFPSSGKGGRPAAAKNAAAANDGVSLSTPAGWKLALTALCANVQGLKTWTVDDITACRDSAQRILALIKRNEG